MNVNPFSYLIEKLKSKADKTEISTAGTGLQKNGTAIGTFVPRMGNSANTKPGQYSFKVEEYVSYASDLPTSDYYHIITSEGMDDKYVTQLAIGMTTDKAFIRRCDNDVWGSWNELAFNTNVCFVSVASESASYTPDKDGLYAFGNIGASTTSFAFVYLLKNTTYTVTQAGLGLGSDPAPGNLKHLYAIKPNI